MKSKARLILMALVLTFVWTLFSGTAQARSQCVHGAACGYNN
jgi:hypothetical protein